MNAFKTPVFNTALATYKRRWPLKADYLDVPRARAVSFIEDFGVRFGLESLRERSNFRHLSFLKPNGFDPLDLQQALELIIDKINAVSQNPERAAALQASLEEYFGPLNGRIAVRLCGWPFVITPQAAMH